MYIEDMGQTFEEKGFPTGVTMVLARPEPWQWSAAAHKSVRQAAALREGSAVILDYGFEAEEFEALGDPDTWSGLADFIYAVELGLVVIKSWTNVCPKGSKVTLPIDRQAVSRLFRIQQYRDHFLAVMRKDGERYRAVPEEGNV